MNELINQSVTLFDTSEKWNAFLDLVEVKEQIQEIFFEKFRSLMKKRFEFDDLRENWSFISKNAIQYEWYLKQYGQQSVSIWLEGAGENLKLSLWFNSNYIDKEKVYALIKGDEFIKLRQCFEIPDESFLGTEYLIREILSTNILNDPSEIGLFNLNRHAWFLYHKTEQIVESIADRVNLFREPEITNLLQKVNAETKL